MNEQPQLREQRQQRVRSAVRCSQLPKVSPKPARAPLAHQEDTAASVQRIREMVGTLKVKVLAPKGDFQMIKQPNRRSRVRVALFSGASIAAVMGMSVPAYAQSTETRAKAPAAADLEASDIVVTATRVTRDGYKAPTPTTVLGSEAIAAAAAPNIANFVNQIPSLSGSATPATQTGYVSNGTNGINALNLRNLGPNRTLVLLDGQRVGPSTTTGWVDVNTFPQSLVKRVDIVTGGASAGWGSDAVAGVVNFVLDKDFTGLKGDFSGGLTTHGDDGNYNASLAAGFKFGGGRGHILASLEYAKDEGVNGLPRSWYTGTKVINNPNYTATNGQPALITLPHVGYSNATPGGVIMSGPLSGTAFGPGGAPFTLGRGPIIDNAASWMQGGPWPYTDIAAYQDLLPETSRKNAFLRASYDLSDHFQVYGQFSYGTANSSVQYGPNLFPSSFGATIQPDNAFIPASLRGQVTGPFAFGTFNLDLGLQQVVTRRSSWRGAVGAKGDFDLAGSNWTWDVYAQRSENNIRVSAQNVMNVGNWFNAIDAVRNPATGTIVCRSTLTNPNNGCVPFNVFGTGVNTQAAVNYSAGTTSGKTLIHETVEAGTLRGNPFSTWAGVVSVAAGIEHRREWVGGVGDPLAGSWYQGNYKATHGAYNVTEGFFETVVPLAKDLPFAKSLDFNGAVRVTSYSLAGSVTTWKAGATWSPVEGVTFRGTQSRDIRAPNLSELFSPGSQTTVGFIDPANPGPGVRGTQITNGNLNLKPEKSDTTSLGIVLQPSFLPGFQASVDYYRINIKGAIATLNGQQIVDQCFNGVTVFCSSVTRNAANQITSVTVQPLNFASQKAKGLDFEASYRRDLETVAPFLSGNLTIHVLATRYLKNVYDNGVTPPVDYAGGNQQTGFGDISLPKWRYFATVGWDKGLFAAQLTARGVSAGKFNTTYIQCTSGCPASTVDNRTIDNNHVNGAIYFDTNFTYKIPGLNDAMVFLNIKNIFDKDPVQVPYGPSIFGAPFSDTNPMLYDTLGRTFRVGVRFKI